MATYYVNTASSGGDGTTNNESGSTAAYASLSAAEDARDGSMSEAVIFLCSCGSGTAADTTGVTFSGWTSNSATNYIEIKNNTGQQAGLSWSDSIYRLTPTNSNALWIQERYLRITGIQAKLISQTTDNLATVRFSSIGGGGSDHRISKCHFRFTSTTQNAQALYVNDADAAVSCWNSVLGGPQVTASLSYAVTALVYNGVLDLNNCTLFGSKYGTAILFGAGTYRAKNCYSGNTGSEDYANATLTTCGSEDSTGTSGLTSIAYSTSSGAYFTNVGSGTENFTIANASSSLIGAGTDGPFTAPLDYTDDIIGTARSDWDLGAFEYAADGTSRTPSVGGGIGRGIGGGIR